MEIIWQFDIKCAHFLENKNYPKRNEITFNTKHFKDLDFDENEICRIEACNMIVYVSISYVYRDEKYKFYLSPRLKSYLKDCHTIKIEKIKHV